MSNDVQSLLGIPYDNLLEARVDKSPSEVVITNDNETYYIVTPDVYEKELKGLGYELVVSDGE